MRFLTISDLPRIAPKQKNKKSSKPIIPIPANRYHPFPIKNPIPKFDFFQFCVIFKYRSGPTWPPTEFLFVIPAKAGIQKGPAGPLKNTSFSGWPLFLTNLPRQRVGSSLQSSSSLSGFESQGRMLVYYTDGRKSINLVTRRTMPRNKPTDPPPAGSTHGSPRHETRTKLV